jgi:hypothetical protein
MSIEKEAEITVVLSANNAVMGDMNVAPSVRQFGGGKPEITKGGITLHVGNRPQARNLRLLYEKTGKKLPADLEVYSAYDLWLLTHTVGIVDNDFARSVQQFGYKVWFPEDMNGGKRISVVKVLPETRFIKNIAGKIESTADLTVSGSAKLPDQLTDLLDMVEGLSADAKIKLSTRANFVGRLSFGVMTTVVNAIGEGDSSSEWVFHREEYPLVGIQSIMQVLRTPKRMRRLEFKAQVYSTIMTWSVQPNKLMSAELRLEADLA